MENEPVNVVGVAEKVNVIPPSEEPSPARDCVEVYVKSVERPVAAPLLPETVMVHVAVSPSRKGLE